VDELAHLLTGLPAHRRGLPERCTSVISSDSLTSGSPSALDYWTLAIAILGATTGLVAMSAQVWQFLLAGPRVRVHIANALTTADGRWWLSVDLVNAGRLPVTVLDIGIVVEKPGQPDEKMPIPAMHASRWNGPPLPHRLIDGDSTTWLVFPAPVAVSLIEHSARPDVHVYARLATGKEIKSDKPNRRCEPGFTDVRTQRRAREPPSRASSKRRSRAAAS
jgi:hypothetical protein